MKIFVVRWPGRLRSVLRLLPPLMLLLAGGVSASGSDKESARSFVDSVAAVVYRLAWPSATYEEVSFRSLDPVQGGYDVFVRLSGKSGIDESDLWLDLVFEWRGGTLHDLRVVRHNAFWVPPFETSKAIGQIVTDLLEEAGGSHQSQESTSSKVARGQRIHFANNCRHPVRLAICYRKLDGSWQTVGWWKRNAWEANYLAFSDGSTLRTDNSVAYYYAETQDGYYYWSGKGYEATLDGRTLPMLSVEDGLGDINLKIDCPGR